MTELLLKCLKKLYKVGGVIGSSVSKLNQMQHMGLETIFRYFPD